MTVHGSKGDRDICVPAPSISNWGAHLKVWLLLLEGSVDLPVTPKFVVKTAKQIGVLVSGEALGQAVGKVSNVSVATSTVTDIMSALSTALGIDGTEAEQGAEEAEKATEAQRLDDLIGARARATSRQHNDAVLLRCLDDATVSSTAPAEKRVLSTVKALLSTVRTALSTASSADDFVAFVSEALRTCPDIPSFVCPIDFKPTSSCLTRLCGQTCAAAKFGQAIGTSHPEAVVEGHGCGHGAAEGMCKNCAAKQGPWLATLKVSEAAPHPMSDTIIWEGGGRGGGGGGGGGGMLGCTGVCWGMI